MKREQERTIQTNCKNERVEAEDWRKKAPKKNNEKQERTHDEWTG